MILFKLFTHLQTDLENMFQWPDLPRLSLLLFLRLGCECRFFKNALLPLTSSIFDLNTRLLNNYSRIMKDPEEDIHTQHCIQWKW